MENNSLFKQLYSVKYSLSKKQIEKDQERCNKIKDVVKITSLGNTTPIDKRLKEIDSILPGTSKKIYDSVKNKKIFSDTKEIDHELKMALSKFGVNWSNDMLEKCKDYIQYTQKQTKRK